MLDEDNSETPYSLGVKYSVAIPPPQNTELKYLPVEVQKAFTQAEKNMTMENCEEPAVIMCRRALEIAIGTQYPHITGKNLKEKIDGLEAQHIIPATMKDWAHEIRSIGNDGAHGLSGVTRADAEAAQAFAAAFLQYCLGLPEEIRQRRAQTNAAGKRTAAADEPVPAEGADFVKA
ncbi:DUF4145 domain-containing protein [Candidatus Tokpelaia sp.]|uniref:DUF4145 domain-containing protein n=1 Tax=Candidatus Tokpelaia sp. TaxID=2233777 RepID=UPI00123C6BB6|nr:DUF4145 domain-containing protein [Candidatus Tokpelaia sp.]